MEYLSSHSIAVLFVFLLWMVSPSGSVNITNLLTKYVSVCGPKLCNIRHASLPVKFNHTYKDHSGCPECACDDECWTRGNCCPDVYLSFPVHSCVKNTILQNTRYQNEEIGFLMVDGCDPKNSANVYSAIGKGEQLRHLPVTTARYNFTFRNETIAACNDEDTDSNWFLGFRCPVMTDFNYLPSYAEIEERAISNQCRISFHPHDIVAARCNTPSRSTVMNKCNMTGQWRSHDGDVEWACGYYGPEVMQHTFSDVYCYICNPSDYFDVKIISKCNATELWDAYDKTIEEACNAYPLTQRTYPFKNYFCRLCNQVSKHSSLFVDADATVEVWPTSPNGTILYRHNFKNVRFDFRFFQSTVKTYEESYNSSEGKYDTFFGDGKMKNITNLLLQYYLTTGFYDVCHKEYLKVSFDKRNSSCVCDARCLFSNEICCVDLALIHSACVNELELSPLQHILSPNDKPNQHVAITGCLAKGSNSAYSERCRSRSKDNITMFDILPVENTNTSLVYENIYCALCGQDHSANTADFLNNIKPFNVEVICKDPLPYENDILLLSTIRRAQAMKCRIRTLPLETKAVCKTEKSEKIGQCKPLGRNDSDVVWACENTKVNTLPVYGNYKNVFCKTCAVLVQRPALFQSCPKATELTEPELAETCQAYPAVPALYPYKNALCRECRLPGYAVKFSSQAPDSSEAEYWSPVPTLQQTDGLKGIFSVFIKEPKEESSEKCNDGELYDTWGKTCRKILCYPGKVLDGNMCTPLISVATNLSYAISYNLVGEITHNETSPGKILNNTEQYIQEHLEVLFNLRRRENVRFLSFYAFSNVSCDHTFAVGKDARMSILLKTTVHVTDTIQRLKSEEKLVRLPGSNIKVFDSKILIPFKVQDETIAYNLSEVVSEMKQAKNCYVTGSVSQEDKLREFYRVSTVSDLLLCKQVELKPTEFEIDSTKMTLKLKNSNVVLSYKDFMLTENKSARICFDKLPVVNPEDTQSCNSGDKTLSIFTVVVMTISLICIIPPFVTYCLFPKLQTLPGLNSMGLFVSLFVVQITFMIQFIGEMTNACNSAGFCVTIGVISHLAWLVFFAWTFICSLHMFFVFVHKDYQSNDSHRWREFRRYVIGSLSFPLAIVLVHIVLTAAITEGDEIGYGRTRCFISNTIGTVLSFIVPVAVVCIINSVFFIMAYRKISEKTKVSNSQNEQQLYRAILKLFILTGVTWILQIIDGFLPVSPFSYIVTVLNALQGLYIFVLFVCNTAVFNMYRNFKETIKEKRPRQSFSSTMRRKYKDLSRSGRSVIKTSDTSVSHDSESRDESQSYDNLAYVDQVESENEGYTSMHVSEKYMENENVVSTPETVSNNCECSSINSNSCDSIDDDTDKPENPTDISVSETAMADIIVNIT